MKAKVRNFVSREIESKPENKATLFVIILVFNLILFGYLGVYRGFVSYREKRVVMEELRGLESNLNRNLQIITDLEPYVRDNTGALYVDLAITDEPSVSQYLKDVSTIASRNGFIVKAFSFDSKKGKGDIPIPGQLIGSDENIGTFLSEIEDMERLTNVNILSIADSSKYFTGLSLFSIQMEIYSLDER